MNNISDQFQPLTGQVEGNRKKKMSPLRGACRSAAMLDITHWHVTDRKRNLLLRYSHFIQLDKHNNVI